jgi:hypothetical protein
VLSDASTERHHGWLLPAEQQTPATTMPGQHYLPARAIPAPCRVFRSLLNHKQKHCWPSVHAATPTVYSTPAPAPFGPGELMQRPLLTPPTSLEQVIQAAVGVILQEDSNTGSADHALQQGQHAIAPCTLSAYIHMHPARMRLQERRCLRHRWASVGTCIHACCVSANRRLVCITVTGRCHSLPPAHLHDDHGRVQAQRTEASDGGV